MRPVLLVSRSGLGSREEHDNITASWCAAGLEEDVSAVLLRARRTREDVSKRGGNVQFFYPNTIQ
jgi:hypothetical protein